MSNDMQEYISHKACYYITFNTVDWVDIFVRPAYKEIVAETLNYLIAKNGLIVYAWCLMSNHLHMLAQAKEGSVMTQIEKEFKKITTQKILETINQGNELRHEWMLQRFEQCSHDMKKIERFQVWQSCRNPVLIDFSQIFKLQERLLYIHENPVRNLVVSQPQDFIYSSAADYAGIRKGPVKVQLLNFDELRRMLIKPDSGD